MNFSQIKEHSQGAVLNQYIDLAFETAPMTDVKTWGICTRIERCTPKRPSIVKCLAVKRSAENALPGVLFLSLFSTSFLSEKRDGKLPFRKCFESVHAGLRDGVSS